MDASTAADAMRQMRCESLSDLLLKWLYIGCDDIVDATVMCGLYVVGQCYGSMDCQNSED